LQIIVFDIQIS